MKDYSKILIGLTALLYSTYVSCTKDLKLPSVQSEKKIVLLGELTGGDTVYIRAGQSAPIVSGSPLQFQILSNLNIILKDENATYTLHGSYDTLTQQLRTLPYSLGNSIQYGKSYSLIADHSTLGKASVVVHIPELIEATVIDTSSILFNSEPVLHVKIQINDDANVDNYYMIECIKQHMNVEGYFYYNGNWLNIKTNKQLYSALKAQGSTTEKYDTVYYKNYFRQGLFTDDYNTENALDGSINVIHNRVLIKDGSFNGTNYATNVYIRKTNLISQTDSLKGILLLHIKSVSADYFKFLKSYEQYELIGSFNTFAQPIKIEGNIENGLGMIGGVSLKKYSYLFDKWDF